MLRGRVNFRCLAAALAAGVASAWISTAPLAAQTADAFNPMLGVAIEDALQDGYTDRALQMIDEALAGTDDPRVVGDLLARKAEILSRAGRHAEAAEALEQQAGTVEADKGETAPELIPVLDKAAAAQLAANQPAEAVALLSRLLDVMVAGGLKDSAGPFVERLKALAANSDATVAGAAEEALDIFASATETSRGPFAVDPEQGFTTVKLYYATDRARSGKDNPNEFYGGDRGQLEMGTAVVSLPPHHAPGKIERPSMWSLEFREDPGKHVVLKSVTPGESDAVFSDMRAQLAGQGADSAFVFVHGFNVPFNEAAQRTAQMAYDMNFEGVPILYSWPSRASLLSYIADTAVVNLSGRRLTLFLEDVVRKSGAKRIHLIAHSMGNRALTDALELYALRHPGAPPAFDQILFTAPDLDAGLFAEMVKTIRPVAQRLTLYASDKDWALAVSRKIHGDAVRAGQGGANILHAAAVDSIDMTSIGDDMLMHSYYANNPSALTDILSLFWRDASPEERCGMNRIGGDTGGAWVYAPQECDSNALLSTLSMLKRASIGTLSEARAFMNRYVLPATADPDERSRLETALARLFRR